MRKRTEVIDFCMKQTEVYEDYPFSNKKWTLMRHKKNKKVFAWIYERNENIWVNVKCNLEWRDFWRSAYAAIVPGYHQNKEHWNSLILDGTIPDYEIQRLIEESYELTKPKTKK